MTLDALGLRAITPAQQVATQLEARLRQAGLPVTTSPLPVNTVLARYELLDAHGRAEVAAVPQQLSQQCWPEMAGMAWEALTEQGGTALLTALGQPLLSLPGLDQQGMPRWLGPLRTDATTSVQPALQMPWGQVWVQAWEATPAAHQRWLSPAVAQLQLELELELARVALKPKRLARLGVGDVIVLDDITTRLCLDGRGLYRFALQEDCIMMDEIVDEMPFEDLLGPTPVVTAVTATETPQAVEPQPERLVVHELPVTVRVLFNPLTLTVQELTELSVGATLPLPKGVEGDVQLTVNGRCFAKGELVRVGEHLGISLTAVGT